MATPATKLDAAATRGSPPARSSRSMIGCATEMCRGGWTRVMGFPDGFGSNASVAPVVCICEGTVSADNDVRQRQQCRFQSVALTTRTGLPPVSSGWLPLGHHDEDLIGGVSSAEVIRERAGDRVVWGRDAIEKNERHAGLPPLPRPGECSGCLECVADMHGDDPAGGHRKSRADGGPGMVVDHVDGNDGNHGFPRREGRNRIRVDRTDVP